MNSFHAYHELYWILSSPIILMLAQSIVFYTKGNPAKHLKWKNRSIKTNLTQQEFNNRVREICLHKQMLLMEISPTHAFLKQNPCIGSHSGAYYYIELSIAQETTVTVWCCSGFTFDPNTFRKVWLIDMTNEFFQV